MSFINHIRAVLFLPFTVTLLVPLLILLWSGGIHIRWQETTLQIIGTSVGLMLTCTGLLLLISTIRHFISKGKGTLAPWDPTQHLVVDGVYRHVRNPMISGVMMVLFGEATIVGSLWLLLWGLFFTILNMIYIPLSEEPGLEERFGEEYLHYKQNVPRWLPRLRPWDPTQ